MATPPDSPDYGDFMMTFETAKPVKHTRPVKLEELCKQTKFTRQEIRIMYRGFKQECPEGVVQEETFKEIYAKFFPHGNSSIYAHHIFKAFDLNSNGHISFRDLLISLSQLLRGSAYDKLQWAFQLYDVNGDGCITKSELTDIVSSVHELMGRTGGTKNPPSSKGQSRERVDPPGGAKADSQDPPVSPPEQQHQLQLPKPVLKPRKTAKDDVEHEASTSLVMVSLNPSSLTEHSALGGTTSTLDEQEGASGGASQVEDRQTRDHVDRLFKKLDLNGDGVITIDEFIQSCMQDEVITESLKVFEGL